MSIAVGFAVAASLFSFQESPLTHGWDVTLDDVILGSPVVSGDLVIVATKKGTVTAFKMEDGTSPWGYEAKGPVISGLALLNNRIFVPAGEYSPVLDAKTGKLIKEKGPAATRAIAGSSRIYLLGGLEFLGGNYRLGFSNDIAAYEPPSSKPLWREAPSRLGVTAAVEFAGRLFVSSQYHLFILEARSGKELGQATREESKHPGVPYHAVADKDRVIFLSEQVMCYNPKNLKELWNAPVKGTIGFIPPLMTADRLIVFPLPDVVALDLKTGKELWTVKLEGDPHFCTTPPAMRGTEVCVGFNGKLFAVDVTAGKATWTFTASGDPQAPVAQPVWGGDRLFYGVGRRLYCLKPK